MKQKFSDVFKRIKIERLRTKLLLFVITMLIIPNLLVLLFSVNSAKSQLELKMEESTKSSVNLLNDIVDRIVESEIANINMLAFQLSSLDVDKKSAQAQKLMDKFMKEHPAMEILTLGNDNGAWMKSPDPGKGEYDPRTRDWYKNAMKTPGKVIIPDPSVSATTGNHILAISLSFPDGKGALTLCLSLDQINKMVRDVKIGSRGYVYVIDRNSKFVSHPTIAVGEEAVGEYSKIIQGSEFGPVNYNHPETGVKQQGHFVTNALTGFKLVGVLPIAEYSEASMPIVWTSIIVLALSVIGAILVMFFVIRGITKPIEALNHSAKRVSEGYLNEEVLPTRHDEIGELAGNYNVMVASLRHMVVSMTDTSGQLAASSEQLTASTEENTRSVEHVNRLIQESAKGAEQQAISSEDISKTMDEMSQGILKIAESAEKIVESSTKTEKDVRLGNDKVESVSQQMGAIRDSVKESGDLIEQLYKQSEKVSVMSSAITAISGQTNLLSLNAAIEAARAGEHGRGFAVVAGEVRKLADQTTITAEQIQSTIKEMTGLIGGVFDVMKNKVAADVEQGINVTMEARQAFGYIEASTKQIAEQIHDVSAITEQMSASAEEIAASVQEMASISGETLHSFQNVNVVSQENLASLEEIAASAAGLSVMAADMQGKLDKFNLHNKKE